MNKLFPNVCRWFPPTGHRWESDFDFSGEVVMGIGVPMKCRRCEATGMNYYTSVFAYLHLLSKRQRS